MLPAIFLGLSRFFRRRWPPSLCLPALHAQPRDSDTLSLAPKPAKSLRLSAQAPRSDSPHRQLDCRAYVCVEWNVGAHPRPGGGRATRRAVGERIARSRRRFGNDQRSQWNQLGWRLGITSKSSSFWRVHSLWPSIQCGPRW